MTGHLLFWLLLAWAVAGTTAALLLAAAIHAADTPDDWDQHCGDACWFTHDEATETLGTPPPNSRNGRAR